MESTTRTAAEIGNRRALAARTVAHLVDRTGGRVTSELLADLDDEGWAIIQQDMGRTRPFGADTRELILATVTGAEAARATEIDDPFEGL